MKFKVGDKIQYRDFIVKRRPELVGTFVVDQVAEGRHAGCNLISSPDLPSDKLVCSADFVLAE
jgi:hypothetical protein